MANRLTKHVYVTGEIHTLLRIYAAERGIKIQEAVAEAIRLLADKTKKENGKRA